MKIEFYSNQKLVKNEVSIGKTSSLRFKQKLASEFGLEKGQRWKIGVNSEEKQISALYFIRDDNDEGGFKISYSNATFMMNVKGVITKFNIITPNTFKCEVFKDGEYEGFKITLNSDDIRKV